MLQIEELSNQNEDLICKLKESMERELVLRYPILPLLLLLTAACLPSTVLHSYNDFFCLL